MSSMGPLAGNAGPLTTLEQTQMSMSINSVIIIFEWIFTPAISVFHQAVLNERSQRFMNRGKTTQLDCVFFNRFRGKVSSIADCINKILN